MEQTHKKTNQLTVKDKNLKEKNKFFQQVFKQCEMIFSKKQFEFFVKCMIPNRSINNRSSSVHRRSQQSAISHSQQLNIQDINPNVLTMPRKFNFFQQRHISNIIPQKKNRRILTTPTEKVRKQIKFQNYQDFQFYKRMKKHQQSLQQNMTKNTNTKFNHNKSTNLKLYSPEPLFYRSNYIQVPKTVFMLKPNNKIKTKFKKSNYRLHLNMKNHTKIEKQNTFSQLIPSDFIQMIRFPNKEIQYDRFARTGNVKSNR